MSTQDTKNTNPGTEITVSATVSMTVSISVPVDYDDVVTYLGRGETVDPTELADIIRDVALEKASGCDLDFDLHSTDEGWDTDITCGADLDVEDVEDWDNAAEDLAEKIAPFLEEEKEEADKEKEV